MAVRSANARKSKIHQRALAGAFAVALAFPVVAATAASANPTSSTVVLKGTVNCASFGVEFEPTSLTVQSAAGAANTTAINATGPRATYAQLSLSPVSPGAGDNASITLTCTSTVDGLDETKVVNFQLVRPPGAGVTKIVNVL